MHDEIILMLDFGGQYSQLIARRVREAGVYCEIWPYNMSVDRIRSINPAGIILTGGPASVLDDGAPMCDKNVFTLGIPMLGICYGMQLMGHALYGRVDRAPSREYGKTQINFVNTAVLFTNIEPSSSCWMSHTYYVQTPPEGFRITASTSSCPVAAMEDISRKLYGVQFHPEVVHTPRGKDILNNFLFKICKCRGDWKISSFVQQAIEELRSKIGKGNVLCALSGGVDSSVAATLIHKAVGKQLTCIFVDHGLLRKYEGDQVERVFKEGFDMHLIRVNAASRFLEKLKGISEPEQKRKIIGNEFIRVFEEEAQKIGLVDFLGQGTIYPDVIESGQGDAAVIKSHHNVGGLPEHVNFKAIIEPLRNLFKDEVRKVGEELGLPEDLVWRQPFPGPGLAIRILGDVTQEKLDILREADAIYTEEIVKAGLTREIWQYFAVLTGMRSVGVMGDERTYDYTLALRAITSVDGMTADWAHIPYEVLAKISSRTVNEVRHINRVVYDITSKPPATIEWE